MLMSPLFSKPRLALAVAAITGAITASLPAQITEWPTTVEPGRFLLDFAGAYPEGGSAN